MKMISLRLDEKVYEGLVATKPVALSMNAYIGSLLEAGVVGKMEGAMALAVASGKKYANMRAEVGGFERSEPDIDYSDEYRQ